MKKYIVTLLLALLSYPIFAQDWANFGRFEQDNAALATSPKAIFMGNSITELWVGKHPAFFKDHNYVSRGISGQTTSQMLVRFRADVIAHRPEMVVILGGTNDIAQNNSYVSLPHVFENLISMAELARANGIVPVLCSVLPTTDYPWHRGLTPSPKIIALNAMLRDYAKREKIPYVDYYTPMVQADGAMIAAYTYDGVHPTEAGYEMMEKIVSPVLESASKLVYKYRRHAK